MIVDAPSTFATSLYLSSAREYCCALGIGNASSCGKLERSITSTRSARSRCGGRGDRGANAWAKGS